MTGQRHHYRHARLHRRGFLQNVAGAGLAATLGGCATRTARNSNRNARSLVFVRFGGGVRFEDLFGEREHRLAPYLHSMAEAGLFAEVWNDHLTRHDCASAYLMTGCYGSRLTSNDQGAANLAELSGRPALTEALRSARNLPAEKVLAAGMPPFSADPARGAIAFANDATAAPISGDPSLPGAGHLALGNDRLLQLATDLEGGGTQSAATRRAYFEDAARLVMTAMPPDHPALTAAIVQALTDRLMDGAPFISAEQSDTWLIDLTLHAMRTLRPELVTIGLSTPDLAHRGAFGVYAEAVRRNDLLLNRLMNFLARDPFYRDRTDVVVAPDCGRGHAQFESHDVPFDDPSHRRLFLVAAGPSFARRTTLTGRIQQVDVAATAAAALGIDLGAIDGRAIHGAFA